VIRSMLFRLKADIKQKEVGNGTEIFIYLKRKSSFVHCVMYSRV
jgi:hypothetical protein